ncbi:PEP-CTERM sorting domain-containing protein [Luteolibacter sp. AS25]|uniref:PEP-CTERM sorting domain-containing protein n=1 Tax=Luteolibacter sp. AS25 TaxID=3135776 RepID=UPI00398A94ED
MTRRIDTRLVKITLTSILLVLGLGSAHAAVLLHGVAIATNTSPFNTTPISNLTNRAGLSGSYTAGTDLVTYLATNPTEAGTAVANGYVASQASGTFDFDLGSVVTLSHVIIWNTTSGASNRLGAFEVRISNTSDFASSALVGSFTAGASSAFPVAAEAFDVTDTLGRYVRISGTSSGGNSLTFMEVGFAGVPEPSSALLAAISLAGAAFRRKRVVN